MLGLVTSNTAKVDQETIFLSSTDIDMIDKFRINKTKSKVSHHFNTTGKIYSFGHGPKYEKNDLGYSVGQYADKTSRKKITSEEKQQMICIEKKIEGEMVVGIKNISKKLSSMPSITSPEVETLRHLLHLKHKDDIKYKLPEFGFLNCHVCFNAETEIQHTECDSSYTLITVPVQPITEGKGASYNNGVFQFVVNKNEIVTLQMKPGVSFCYSGFLLTHWQQIYKKSSSHPDFVNIVTYNSRMFFEHLMESFRRFINQN